MLTTLQRTVAEVCVIVDMWDIDKQQIMAIISFCMDKSQKYGSSAIVLDLTLDLSGNER